MSIKQDGAIRRRRGFRLFVILCALNLILLAVGVPLGVYGLDLGDVSDIWYWVFAFPMVVAARCGWSPLSWAMLVLNPVIYGAMWYGAWRGFVWLFRRNEGDSASRAP